MSAKRSHRTALTTVCGALLPLLLLLACTADSPTAPDQVAAPTPSPGDNEWDIAISVSPSTLQATVDPNDAEPSVVSVNVRRRDNGQRPPTGSTMVLSTSLGEFNAIDSGVSEVVLQLASGRAEAFLFPGSQAGTARLVGQLEGSVGQATARIEAQDSLFITSVVPSSGGERGGRRVDINGLGFTEPLQVAFGDSPAFVVKVANDGTFVRVDSPAVLDPQSFFNTETCDSNGDGELDGEAYIPTAVTVQVTLQDGPITSATLNNGFTYIPSDQSCRGAPPEPDPPFIQEVVPNTGPDTGGQSVEIRGRGFRQPLRLFIQSKLADVISVSSRKIVAVTPPGDMDTGPCVAAGNVAGTGDIDTPVQIRVEIIDGATETLENAYTYLANPANCVPDP